MSTESMIGTVLGAVINIILAPILISVMGMGAMGAAVADVVSVLTALGLLIRCNPMAQDRSES